jgi:purine-nucleoside phosphorylase
MRIIGGDTVGMSTAPEVIVAHHMDIKCFAISVITDLGVEGKIKKVTHEEIQEIAENAEPKLTLIMKEIIKNIK